MNSEKHEKIHYDVSEAIVAIMMSMVYISTALEAVVPLEKKLEMKKQVNELRDLIKALVKDNSLELREIEIENMFINMIEPLLP